MANMSYCRFENTLKDLRDCQSALNEIEGDLSKLSDSERKFAERLIGVCDDISSDYGTGGYTSDEDFELQ